MKSFIGGLIAGAALLGVGVALGKPSRPATRKHMAYRSFRRSRRNPGFEARANDREIMEYLREARDWMREVRNPKATFPPFNEAGFVKPDNPPPPTPRMSCDECGFIGGHLQACSRWGTANETDRSPKPTRDARDCPHGRPGGCADCIIFARWLFDAEDTPFPEIQDAPPEAKA